MRKAFGTVVARVGRLAGVRLVATALLLAAMSGHQALAAARATVAGAEMNGFGRIIMSFDSRPKSTVRQSGGIVVVTFDQPVKLSSERLASEMPNYVGVLRIDPDGRAIRLGLSKPFKPNMMEAGDQLFIDLLPETWKGLPPGLPQDVVDALTRRMKQAEEEARKAALKRAEEQERRMEFSVGTLPTFRRLSFSLPRLAEVTAKQDGRRVELIFDAPFTVDGEKLKADLAPGVTEVTAETQNAVLRVGMDLPEGVTARMFREDETYVVDIPTPKPAAAEKTSPEAPLVKPGTTKPKAAEAGHAAETKPVEAKAADPRPAPPADDHHGAAAPAAPAPVAANPPAAHPASEAHATEAHAAVAEQPAAPKPVETKPEPAAGPQPGDGKVRVTGERDNLRLQLPLPPKTPVAVFDRGGVLWIAAETPLPLEASEAGTPAFDLLGKPDLRRVGPLAVLRIPLNRPALVRAAPAERGWVVTLGDEVVAPTEALVLKRGSDKDGRTVVLAAFKDVAGVHWVEDPDAGDRLAIVTGRAPARGLVKSQSFVDFRALATAQGLAIAPLADDVTVKPVIDEVAIGREGGLFVSILPVEQPADDKGSTEASLAITPEWWSENQAGHPRLRMEELWKAAAAANRSRRGEARMALGRLQLAIGLAAEAGGSFDVAAAEDPALTTDRSALILRAAAKALSARPDEAAAVLGEPIIKDDPEALLWRGYIEATRGKWGPALVAFRRAGPTIDRYPDELQGRLRELYARAAIETRDFGLAQTVLDALEMLPPESRDHDRLALLRARLADGQGRTDEALPAYQELVAKASRPVAAQARLHAVSAGLKEGTLDRKAAITELETLGVTWRGDDIEAKTLGMLGRLYADDARWRDAFSVARTANTLFPDHDETRSLYDDAGSRFEALFLTGKADSIPRVDALALYFDFKEFTPVGRRGDELIRRLAERLVELDLLSEASDLLQYQVDNRLSGAAKSTVATRLAVIYLMNKQPSRALQALQDSRIAELPTEMRRGRSLLEARAMSDLSRTDLALDTIANETGPDAERLRADILWQGHRWREAGETFERIVGDSWQQTGPLDDRTRADVMRAAIAYGLGEEPLSLERLRAKFTGKMSDSIDARAFAMATAPKTAKPGDVREIARAVASADTFAEFLAEYRKRYPDVMPLPPKPAPSKPAEPAKAEAKAPADAKAAGEAKPGETKPTEGKPGEAKPAEPKPAAQAAPAAKEPEEKKTSEQKKPAPGAKPAGQARAPVASPTRTARDAPARIRPQDRPPAPPLPPTRVAAAPDEAGGRR